MGRGRAKAKQAKVARQLKYNTPEMDLERLQRELSGGSGHSGSHANDDYDYEADYDVDYDGAYDDDYEGYDEYGKYGDSHGDKRH